MIKLQGIYRYYDNKFQRTFVLKDIDLEVQEGDFISIMGPSGAGKSTLLNILGMLDTPDEGAYYFMDKPVQAIKEKDRVMYHRNYIGFIFQAFHLINEMTVYENIETPLIYKGIKRKVRQAMVADMLDRFNMVAKKDLFPEQLSGGQQQLVAIARAIVAKPKLLLADEPTGNLHRDQGNEIMKLLKTLNSEGITIVQVTHNDAYAAMGKNTYRIVDGMMQKANSAVMV